MGWETHGAPVESDGGLLREVYHSRTNKNKIMLSDYFCWYPALLHPPTLPTSITVMFFFFFYRPHIHIHRDSWTERSAALGNSVDTMCFDSSCFDRSVSSVDSTGPEVPLSREEEVDLTLLKNDSGVESALLYAKAWSKYIKDLLAWMEKRMAMGKTIFRALVCKQRFVTGQEYL